MNWKDKLRPTIMVGDKVKCIENPGDTHGKGAGWRLNKIFIVGDITPGPSDRCIYWPDNKGSGVYSGYVEKVI